MFSVAIALEELEYMLVQNKCEYLYGLPDAFIKIDRKDIYKKFDQIADTLEARGLLTRSFKGGVTYDNNMEKIINVIKNVQKFYDITLIEMSEISKKYRIYAVDDEYVSMEILGEGGKKLDYSQIYIKYMNKMEIESNMKKSVKGLYKLNNKQYNQKLVIGSAIYKQLDKMKEDKFITYFKDIDSDKMDYIKMVYKTITYAEKVLSVVVTDMIKRDSNSYMYVSAFKNMVKMEFEKKVDNYFWNTSQIDTNDFDAEINTILV